MWPKDYYFTSLEELMESGDLDGIKWKWCHRNDTDYSRMDSMHPSGMSFFRYVTYYASERNHLSVLDWWFKNRLELPEQNIDETILVVLIYGKIDILNWWINNSKSLRIDNHYRQQLIKKRNERGFMVGIISKLHDEETSCCICFNEFIDEKICKLSCGHYYHIECINTWINHQNICPQCRKII